MLILKKYLHDKSAIFNFNLKYENIFLGYIFSI